jgi:3-oxoacyl-[acyl-carrier-protein] synthase II
MLSALEPVVITGMGVVACNGIGRQAYWDALVAGKSGIGPITHFDASDLPCRIAGEVKDFNPKDFIKVADVKRWHRPVHLAMAAAVLAEADSEFSRAGYAGERLAGGIGTSVGSLDASYDDYRRMYAEKGWTGVDRMASSSTSGHSATAAISARYGLRGPAITIGSGCATGLDILAWGRQQIRSGRADAAMVGATEAPINGMTFAATCALGILSDCNDEPARAMRPFDESTDALVLSEAAVVFILERRDRAAARGARILAELWGTGSAAEGRNPLVLERDGVAVARAVTESLRQAGLQPHEIDCIHCHGVGLTMYDRCETKAYKTALGDHVRKIPLTAPKSMIGQAYAPGGLLSIASAALTLNNGAVPPTINLEHPDPECDLDYVPLRGRTNDIGSVLVTALSFGGTHAAAVVGRSN